jgi:diguanylate cyclase (GGDEF)-like protein
MVRSILDRVPSPRASYLQALGLTRRFQLVLVVLVLVLGAVGWAGLSGLSASRRSLESIYRTNVTDQQVVSDLIGTLDDAQQLILRGWVSPERATLAHLAVALNSTDLPRIELDISKLHGIASGNPQEEKIATAIGDQWIRAEAIWGDGQWSNGSYPDRRARVAAVTSGFATLTTSADIINALEYRDGTRRTQQARADASASKQTMILVLAFGVILSLATTLWLTRAVLPRILSFARFAGRIAQGDYRTRLASRGDDELARLGRTLDDVADRRQQSEDFERTQGEFSESLQLIEDEREAQELIQRHLERSIPAATVTVFNKNNSADRLEAVTTLAPDSRLSAALRGASPGDCLAIRGAATHTETPEHEPLLGCKVCSGCSGKRTCTPLLVGGEVIGSLLLQHDGALDGDDVRRMRESVAQAAPVIANLRNLAIAQLRAATDALTGLPNRRALDDMIKRVVAQAHHANMPVAALMLDLDHFKRANDTFGHSKGDEILAALGASLPNWIRRTDFAARYGGEEFVVLLPETDLPGALIIAEKIRSGVAEIHLAGLDLELSASLGVAVLPSHAIDSEELVRAADRALYAAKTNGRNRVEVASGPAALASEAVVV